jgi:ethanolamine utilization protein EutQ (cupin superfamily)
MKEVIEKFKKIEKKLITYREIENLPLGVEIDFSIPKDNSILCTRLSDTSSGMSFRVVMQSNTKWENHMHDCDETIMVFKGRIKGLLNNIIAGRGSIIEIPKKTYHEIYAEEYSQFYVEFKKPLIENGTMAYR